LLEKSTQTGNRRAASGVLGPVFRETRLKARISIRESGAR
jgi:hypothetical protein